MATEWRLRTSVSHVGGAVTSAEQLQAMGRRRQKGCFFVFRSQKAEKEHTKKSCVAVRITSWVHTGLLHGDCLPHRGSKGVFFAWAKSTERYECSRRSIRFCACTHLAQRVSITNVSNLCGGPAEERGMAKPCPT